MTDEHVAKLQTIAKQAEAVRRDAGLGPSAATQLVLLKHVAALEVTSDRTLDNLVEALRINTRMMDYLNELKHRIEVLEAALIARKS